VQGGIASYPVTLGEADSWIWLQSRPKRCVVYRFTCLWQVLVAARMESFHSFFRQRNQI